MHPIRSDAAGRNRFLIAMTCGCLFGLSVAAHAKSKNEVPAWVKEAAAQSLPPYGPKTKAVLLLEDVHFSVAAQGNTTEHVRRVWKILRPQGREEHSQVWAFFGNDRKLRTMQAWSIGPDGKEYAVDPKSAVDHSAGAGFELYSDAMVRVMDVPAVDVGSIVALEYDQDSHPYINDFVWHTQDDIPVRKERLIVTLPAKFTQKSVWKGAHRTEARDLENGKTLWELENVPAIDREDVPMSPSARGLMGRLDVHYSPAGGVAPTAEWKGMGQWYEDLARGRNASTDAIAAKAKELVANKSDFADRAQAIGEYVQQKIRYVAIEIGVGGDQPHFASDIFTHQYGDCKDKATLASAMMSAVGMRSTWVMVDSHRGVIDPTAPSVAGNHMIAAIEIPKGYESPRLQSVVTAESGKRYLIFDPTWEKTPFGQLEKELQGSYGLLVDGPDSQAIRLPLLKPEHNSIHRTARLALDADGQLKGTITEVRFGDIARRRRELYTNRTEKQQTEYMQRQLGRDFTEFSFGDLKVENADKLTEHLRVSYSLRADHFSRSMGPLLMVRPRVFGSNSYTLDHKERKLPIDLDETMSEEDDFEITLPYGYKLDELPLPTKLDLGFASYESHSEVKDGKLIYRRTFSVREITLPANKYDELLRLAGVIEADEQNTAILKRL